VTGCRLIGGSADSTACQNTQQTQMNQSISLGFLSSYSILHAE
jgi:hypothetical protein